MLREDELDGIYDGDDSEIEDNVNQASTDATNQNLYESGLITPHDL